MVLILPYTIAKKAPEVDHDISVIVRKLGSGIKRKSGSLQIVRVPGKTI
jgi:hypothetical protein